MQMIKDKERLFDRSEENLNKLGITKPFDQYYVDWVNEHNCGDQIALMGPCAEWSGRKDRDFAYWDASICANTSDKYRYLKHGQLLAYANYLAQFLITKFSTIGLSELAGHVIPIYLGRTTDMVAAMLGIMRAGAAFSLLDEVELDEKGDISASERFKDYFSNHSRPIHYLITTQLLWEPIKKLIEELNASSPIIRIEPIFLETFFLGFHPNNYKEPNDFKSRSSKDRLSYVAFSSGTSATPKGINILHSGLVSRLISHYIVFEENNYNMKEPLKVPLIAPLRFDASIMQILLGLGCGGRVLVVDENARNNMPLLLSYLQNTEMSAAILIPDQFRALDKLCKDPQIALPALRIILSTGEAFDANLLERWLYDLLMLINAYGPTEMTVGLTLGMIKRLQKLRRSPEIIGIGQPMLGTRLLIVKECELLREGQEFEVLAKLDPGQSYVENCDEGEIFALDINPEYACRAQCYTNEPIMQERNFIRVKEEGGRYKVVGPYAGVPAYRTGDRARIIDGELCVLGRYGVKQFKKNGRLLRLDAVEAVLKDYLKAGRYPLFTSVKIDYRPDTKHVVAYLNDFGIDPSQRDKLLTEIAGDHEAIFRDVRDYAQKHLDAYMLPSRWMLTTIESMGKADGAPVKLPTDDALRIIYRRGGANHQSQIINHIKQAWLETFNDLMPDLINDDTQFDELGGDSFQYTLMLGYLQRRLVNSGIISDKDYTRNLYQALRGKRKFSDFVSTIENYQRQVEIIKNNIKDGEGLQFASDGTLFLFRSPFGFEQYANLKRELCKNYFVYEIEVSTEENQAQQAKQLECFAHAIIKKLDAHHNDQQYIILGGHSAGGNLAFWVAQKLADINNKYKIIVLMLDTPASAFAQRIDQEGYIAHITYCLCASINTKKYQVIQVEFNKMLGDAGLVQSLGNDDNVALLEKKHKIINLAEEYLLRNIGEGLTAKKITSMINFCRLQLIPDNDTTCRDNVHVRLMTSRKYRNKVSIIEQDNESKNKLLWCDSIIRRNQDALDTTEEHEDFITDKNPGLIAAKISKVLENTKNHSDQQVKLKRTGEIVRRILMKMVSSLLESNEHQEMLCYIEPEYEGELLKNRIIRIMKSHKKANLSLLLKGDAGMGKTLFMLKFAQYLLMEETDFVPIYVSMVNAYERGFLRDTSYLKVIAELCCAQKERGEDLSKHDVMDYLSCSNIIYLNDGCDEIPDKKLEGIYTQCLKEDKGHADGYIRHILFTCRNEVLIRHKAQVQSWFSSTTAPKVLVSQLELKALSYQQVNFYLKNFVDSQFKSHTLAEREYILKRHMSWLQELPGLDKLTQNPLLLHLVAQVLPAIANNLQPQQHQESILLTRPIIYANFFMKWIEREEAKFNTSKYQSPDVMVFMNPPRMSLYVAVYSINLVIYLWKHQGHEFKIQSGALDDSITLQQELLKPDKRTKAIFMSIVSSSCRDPIVKKNWLDRYEEMERHYTGENMQLDHVSDEKLFSGEMRYNVQSLSPWEYNDPINRDSLSKARIRLIRAHSLLKVCDNEHVSSYKYVHKSIVEYLTGMGILSGLSTLKVIMNEMDLDVARHHLINEKPMREDPQLIKMVAEHYRCGEDECNQFLSNLFELVLATREYSGLAIAASNAISIIVVIDPLYLKRRSVTDVEIPFADISNAFCLQTNFGNTDMSGVWCHNTDFTGAIYNRSKISRRFQGSDNNPVEMQMDFGEYSRLNYRKFLAVNKVNGAWFGVNANGVVYKFNADLSGVVHKEKTQHSNVSRSQITESGYAFLVTIINKWCHISCFMIESDDESSSERFMLNKCRPSIKIKIDTLITCTIDEQCQYVVIGAVNNNSLEVQVIHLVSQRIFSFKITDDVSEMNRHGETIMFTKVKFSPSGLYACIGVTDTLLVSMKLGEYMTYNDVYIATIRYRGHHGVVDSLLLSDWRRGFDIRYIDIGDQSLSEDIAKQSIGADLAGWLEDGESKALNLSQCYSNPFIIFKSRGANGHRKQLCIKIGSLYKYIYVQDRDVDNDIVHCDTSGTFYLYLKILRSLLRGQFEHVDYNASSIDDLGRVICALQYRDYDYNRLQVYKFSFDVNVKFAYFQPTLVHDNVEISSNILEGFGVHYSNADFHFDPNREIYITHIDDQQYRCDFRHLTSVRTHKSNHLIAINGGQLPIVNAEMFMGRVILAIRFSFSDGNICEIVSKGSDGLALTTVNPLSVNCDYNSTRFKSESRVLEIDDKLYFSFHSAKSNEVVLNVVDNLKFVYASAHKNSLVLRKSHFSDKKAQFNKADPFIHLKASHFMRAKRLLVIEYSTSVDFWLQVMVIPLDCLHARLIIADEQRYIPNSSKDNAFVLLRKLNGLYSLLYNYRECININIEPDYFCDAHKVIIDSSVSGGRCENREILSELLIKVGIIFQNNFVDKLRSLITCVKNVRSILSSKDGVLFLHREVFLRGNNRLPSEGLVDVITYCFDEDDVPIAYSMKDEVSNKMDVDLKSGQDLIEPLKFSREILSYQLINRLNNPSYVILGCTKGRDFNITSSYLRTYKVSVGGGVITLPPRGVLDAIIDAQDYWKIFLSTANRVGEFYVVIVQTRYKPSQNHLFMCYIFSGRDRDPLCLIESKFTSQPSMCLPSIKLSSILTVQNKNELYVLRVYKKTVSMDSLIFKSPDKIIGLHFSNNEEDKLVVLTPSSVYLFAIKFENNSLLRNLLWFSGEKQLNLNNAKFHDVFGVTDAQRKFFELGAQESRSSNLRPFDNMNSLFYKPEPSKAIVENISMFNNLNPNQRLTADEWVVTVCIKNGLYPFSERPNFIVIEGIHQGNYVIFMARKVNGFVLVERVRHIQEILRDSKNDDHLKQYSVSKPAGVRLISFLRSDNDLIRGDKSISDWVGYVLTKFDIAAESANSLSL